MPKASSKAPLRLAPAETTAAKACGVTTDGPVHCLLVDIPTAVLPSLLKELNRASLSNLAYMAQQAARWVTSTLGPLPRAEAQAIATPGAYPEAVQAFVPGKTNILCIGVTPSNAQKAGAFLQELRRQGVPALAVAMVDPALPETKRADLLARGFDRVLLTTEDPAVLHSLVLSMARNAALRAKTRPTTETYGPFRFLMQQEGQRRLLTQSHIATAEGALLPYRLSPAESLLLECVLQEPGQMVSRENLCAYVYGECGPDDMKRQTVLLSKLRADMNSNLTQNGYALSRGDGPLQTVWGEGLRFDPHFAFTRLRPTTPAAAPTAATESATVKAPSL